MDVTTAVALHEDLINATLAIEKVYSIRSNQASIEGEQNLSL